MIIYVLTNPDSGIGRYIGKANDPWERYRCHLYPSQLRARTHKNYWIKSILAKGKRPGMEVLATVDAENADTAEIAYIAAFRMMGFNLTNGTDGGDGTNGCSPSEDTRRKMSDAHKGIKLGYKRTKAHCRKISEALKGRKHTEETKQRMSEARKGKKKPPFTKAHCRAIGDAQRDKPKECMQGENHPRAKMTNVTVIEARALYATGKWTQRELAEHFDINQMSMCRIINRRTWKYI